MTPNEFRRRFNDMGAGFVGWWRVSPGMVVVSCKVYDTFAHQGAWLASASTARRVSTSALKSFGVHGFKFSGRPYKNTPERLIQAAADNPSAVVALLPDGELLVFPHHPEGC